MSLLIPESQGIIAASHIHPIGSTYTSVVNVNPSEYFGGTWKNIQSDYDTIYLCSQIVHRGSTFTASAKTGVKTVLSGNVTSNFKSLEWPFSVPNGYSLKYKFSMIISTANSVNNSLQINGVEVANGTTWSNDLYRNTVIGDFINLDDITPSEITDVGYSHIGYVYSLYSYNNSSSSTEIRLKDVTKHLYAVSDDKFYKWIRIE